jgi:hypothetical protein
MITSIEIIQIASDSQNGDVYLACKMADSDFEIYRAHPQRLIVLGVVYRKTGWDSDKCIVHYKRVR